MLGRTLCVQLLSPKKQCDKEWTEWTKSEMSHIKMRSWSLLDLRMQTLSTLTPRSRTDGETMIFFPDGFQYFSMSCNTLHYFTIVFNIVQHISIHFDIPQYSNTFPSVGSKRYSLGESPICCIIIALATSNYCCKHIPQWSMTGYIGCTLPPSTLA